MTCRLADRPPASGALFTVTALDPPYFAAEEDEPATGPAEGGQTFPEQVAG
jgi:hypothetical protein